MSNKPILPNAYVDINNRNLGLAPSGISGIFAFIGICQEGAASFDAIVSLGKGDIAAQIGYGELANELLDFFDNGGRKALAVPLDIVTEATGTGAMTPTRVGTSTGTIALDKLSGKKITIGADVQVEVTKTGDSGVARFTYSIDGGTTKSEQILVPAATFTIPGTNMELTFTKGAGPTYWEDGDLFDSTIVKPGVSTAKIETAVDTLIQSNETFDAIVIVPDCSAALGASIATAVKTEAEASPNFRYCYAMIHGTLATSDMSDLVTIYSTIRGSVENDRVQIVAAEAVCSLPNHGNAEAEKVAIGALAGRRSNLDLQNDLGRFDAGSLANVLRLRTNMTETLTEDLDAIYCVTIRRFKGTAGFRPTNGHMSDPFSDIKKDAWRLVLDKASRISRVTALGYLKIEINPSAVQESTQPLKDAIQGAVDRQIVGNGEAVAFDISIPDQPDILTNETLDVNISAQVYGHASWIGITIAISNPAATA